MQSLVTLLGNLDLPRLRRKTILLVTPLPSQYGFIVDTPHRHQACTIFPSTMTRFGPFSVDLITTFDKTQFSPPRVLYDSYSTIRATFVKITSCSTWTIQFSSILPLIRSNAPVTISSATPIMIRVNGVHSATIRSCVR